MIHSFIRMKQPTYSMKSDEAGFLEVIPTLISDLCQRDRERLVDIYTDDDKFLSGELTTRNNVIHSLIRLKQPTYSVKSAKDRWTACCPR